MLVLRWFHAIMLAMQNHTCFYSLSFIFILLLMSCQSQDPFVQASKSLSPEVPAKDKAGLYSPGFSRLEDPAPPVTVAEYFKTGTGTIRFPYVENDTITFAVSAKNADLVSMWMSAQEGDDPDVMQRYAGTDWYWISYKVPPAAEIRYHFNIRTITEERMTWRDPLNPAVSAQAPYDSLWTPEGGKSIGRLEYLEVPYDIPDRGKPAGYAPPAIRKILIYVPPAYDSNIDERYPVIYMQDGQNTWDSSTANYGGWKADRVLNKLIGEGLIRKPIVVSIFNTSYRSEEYAGAGFAAAGRPGGDRAQAVAAYYRDWVISVLKPLIDSKYRTLKGNSDTGVLGSSYGGTVAVYWSFSRPDIFGFAGALSYAPGDEQNLSGGMTSLCKETYLPELVKQHLSYPRLWLDCGQSGLDKTLAPFVAALDKVLQEGGYTQGSDYHFELFSGADHNEAAWYRRLPEILQFLLPLQKR